MDLAEFREYCLAKPGTTEGTPFGPDVLVFKVTGKIFALAAFDEVPPTVNLKCDPDLALDLRDRYEQVRPGYHMNRKHWNTVEIEGRIPTVELRRMIDHSYDLVVEKLPKTARPRQGLVSHDEGQRGVLQRFAMPITLDHLRRYAVARSLFKPTTLKSALYRLGFVQADPIRAPARAQDLILRHRVKHYRAGDLERLYPKLEIEEDFFIVYGFMTKQLQALMHPRSEVDVPAEGPRAWPAERKKLAKLVLEFVTDLGEVHPREVDDHFSHGSVKNYWGGLSSATTHLLAAMHYRGMLRIVRRENGIRIYAVREHGPAVDRAERRKRLDALVDAAVQIYAPLPGKCLADLVRRLRFAVPQWRGDLKNALERAKQRLARTRVEGVDWYWSPQENPTRSSLKETVRLLTPFDPVVWDRDRFEMFWGWQYRFEAYVPPAKRRLGYYALPMLYGDRVIGWANLRIENRQLKSQFGYVAGRPRDAVFTRELDAELQRVKAFFAVG